MDTISYSFGKLGKFLVGREEGRNAYYVLKRDVFDKLQLGQKVIFTFEGVTIFNPSFGDETIGELFVEYPDTILISTTASYAVRKALETIEITRKIIFKYTE